jgi:hypothetical protein
MNIWRLNSPLLKFKTMTDSQYQLKKLEAKRLGINEDDVEASNDIFQLLNWQIEITKDIANINGQLEKYRLACNEQCGEIDGDWHRKAKSSKELLQIFVQKINVRVQEIKASKNVLDQDIFSRIMEAAL